MLKAAGLLQKDAKNGKESLTLAAVLLFGRELAIQSVLPQYKTDALLKIKQVDRYDDRIDIRVNLIESFLLLMSFVARHLPDPFYMENETRISLRDKIFREMAANMLVHREYTSGYAGRFMPFQKNPLISKFFLQMGWVEEIGSGMFNIDKYLPMYAKNARVEYTEQEIFKAEIWYGAPQAAPQDTPQATPQAKEGQLSGLEKKVLGLIVADSKVSRAQMAKKLGVSSDTVKEYVDKLKAKGVLKRMGKTSRD